jgi:predicted MFS family arabinose efflux permease
VPRLRRDCDSHGVADSLRSLDRLRRDPATWLIYGQLGIWGYFLYGFGPVVPLLRDEQRVSATVASLHGTAIAAGAVVGGAIFPYVVRRIGRGAALWLSLAGVAGTVLGLCLARPIAATLSATVAIAVFGTVLVGAVVATLSAHHGPAGPAAISEANAAACGMGVLAPAVIGASIGAGFGWRPGLAVAAGLVALLAVVAFSLRVRVPRGSSAIRAPGSARLPRAYWLAWAMMSITSSVEVCLSLWVVDVLRNHAGMAAGRAAAAVSAIVGGMFLGRLAGGRLSLRVGIVPLFLAVLGVSATGFVVFWSTTMPWVAVAGLVVLGLGNAMHYPLGISMALRAAPGLEDRAAARASYGMAIGFGVAPFALGAIADQVGTHTAFLIVPVLLVAAAALVGLLAAGQREPVGDRQHDRVDPAIA